MRSLFISIVLVFIAANAFAQGAWGAYTITGIMIDKKTKQPLHNSTIVIKTTLRNKYIPNTVLVDTIVTDNQGKFSYQMPWLVECISGITKAEWRRKTRNLNSKKISFFYNAHTKTIKNKWRKRKKEENKNPTKLFFIRLYW